MSAITIRAAAVIAGITLAGAVLSAVPRVISFQGRLTDDTGVPLADGAYNIAVSIWTDSASADPNDKVWKSGPVTVNTVDGLFSVNLGEPPMAVLPPLVAADTNLWVGISVGLEPEGAPRLRITSAVFAFRALYADTALYALDAPMAGGDHGTLMGLGDDDHPQYFLANGSRSLSGTVDVGYHQIRNLAPGTTASDAIRYDQAMKSGDAAGGDLTGTYPNPQLRDGSVGAAEIADGSISNADISASAAIATSKISGTACNLSSAQTLIGAKTFNGAIYVGDSSFWANGSGIVIGSRSTTPVWNKPLYVARDYNSGSSVYGIYSDVENSSTGSLVGTWQRAISNATSGDVRAADFSALADPDHSGRRYGLNAFGGSPLNTLGYSYGVMANARGGAYAYGIYATAEYATTNVAGLFEGDVGVTGTLYKAAGSFRIDHPLDPENKYLQHSFVESPDMKNIYDGVAVTNGDGLAVVELPSYFEALNQDVRYQLTVIGQFAQAIINEKISGGQFTIRTDKPHVEVSWQVTGIRKDPYAVANRIEVEVDKPIPQRGYYQNPKVYGLGNEHSVNRENLLEPDQQVREEGRE